MACPVTFRRYDLEVPVLIQVCNCIAPPILLLLNLPVRIVFGESRQLFFCLCLWIQLVRLRCISGNGHIRNRNRILVKDTSIPHIIIDNNLLISTNVYITK